MQARSSNIEAEKIFYALFKCGCPPEVAIRYQRATKLLAADWPENIWQQTNRVIVTAHDLESLEFAARMFGRLPLLVLRFRVMVYIAECSPDLRARFVNKKNCFAQALLSLIGATILSSFKLTKGAWTLYRLRESQY